MGGIDGLFAAVRDSRLGDAALHTWEGTGGSDNPLGASWIGIVFGFWSLLLGTGASLTLYLLYLGGVVAFDSEPRRRPRLVAEPGPARRHRRRPGRPAVHPGLGALFLLWQWWRPVEVPTEPPAETERQPGRPD